MATKSSNKPIDIELMTLEEIQAQMTRLETARRKAISAQLQPMKDRYGNLKEELVILGDQIKSADPSWSDIPRRPDLLLSDTMREKSNNLPATPETIYAWVQDDPRLTMERVKSMLIKGSQGLRNRFVSTTDGKYALKH